MHLGNSILLYRLMFDPYAKIVYDYMGGIQDIRKAKVCMYFHFDFSSKSCKGRTVNPINAHFI